MENEQGNKFVATELEWDNYMEYLIASINESKFMKRAENKPMSTPIADAESHLTSRALHLRQSADIAKRLADELGLNGQFIYAAMLMHDAGHPFSAHEGEEIFSDINELTNCQYFHHNAKGVEVVLGEDICGMAIDRIPNIENNPELREKLEHEFYYFLDVIISHDGEASIADMDKTEEKYNDIEDAVKDKLKKANSQNDYKFVAQTPEGKLAKMADVIAYIATDMQDAFRTGIMNDFDEDYLEVLGIILSKDFPGLEKQAKVESARTIIRQIQANKIREQLKDAMTSENQVLLNVSRSIITQINAIPDITEDEKNEIIELHVSKYESEHPATNDQERMSLDVQTDKIREFTERLLQINTAVVMEITSRIQTFLINDILRNSQNSAVPGYSKGTAKLVSKLKILDYDKFVKKTKWEYQLTELPKQSLKLSRVCARSLIKTGIITNKFYDESIRKYIRENYVQDGEVALKYMEQEYDEEIRRKNLEYRRTLGIKRGKAVEYTGKKAFIAEKKELINGILPEMFKHVEKQGEVFAIKYMNTYYAISDRVRKKVNKALEIEKGNEDEAAYYKRQSQCQLDGFKKRFKDEYEKEIPENVEAFIKEITEEELKKMPEKMAYQLASDYLAGMTDRSFNDTLVKVGLMNKEIIAQSKRGGTSTSVLNTQRKIEEDLERQRQSTYEQGDI